MYRVYRLLFSIYGPEYSTEYYFSGRYMNRARSARRLVLLLQRAPAHGLSRSAGERADGRACGRGLFAHQLPGVPVVPDKEDIETPPAGSGTRPMVTRRERD